MTGNHFAVAAGHKLTAEAAADVLKSGGNAVDAAVAAFFMTWVAEPCMSSAGGGAFANIFIDGKNHFLDFFCQTPKKKGAITEIEFYPIEVDFGGITEEFQIGKGSTGVPGAIAGAFAMHRAFGTIPMKTLVQPAVKAAKEGVKVVGFQQKDFSLLEPILEKEADGRSLFFREGKLVQVGDVMKMPRLADYLEYLAGEGPDAFYRGEVMQNIVKDYESGGGFLRREDFESYEPVVRKGLSFSYRDFKVITNPGPSYGGGLIKQYLTLLSKEELGFSPFSREHFRRMYHILFETDRLVKQTENISASGRGNTTHFSITDKLGNAVALTASNGEGCGYFVRNTDIQLNNMLGEAALLPGGFHSWVPDTRLPSMMSPTLVFDVEDKLKLVTGSSGAGRIAPAIIQSVHYFLDMGIPCQESVDAPRMHYAHENLNAEPGWILPEKMPENIINWIDQSLFFGGVNAVAISKGGIAAGADSRREGHTIIG